MDQPRVIFSHAPEWRRVEDGLPEMAPDEDICGKERSRDVLLWMGSRAMIGHVERWDDDDPADLRWRLAGRDGYEAEGVTHWRWLPMSPTIRETSRISTRRNDS